MAYSNSKPNYDSILYFTDPASPFMRAIVDLHDYVFMFLVGILIFVGFILYVIIRNNSLLIYSGRRNFYARNFRQGGIRTLHSGNIAFNGAILGSVYNYLFSKYFVLFFIFYYDLVIGTRFYYYYELLSLNKDTTGFFTKIALFLLKPHFLARRIIDIDSEFSISHKSISTYAAQFYFYVISFPWFFFTRYGSSFTQFYLFFLFIVNKVEKINTSFVFNRYYALQLLVSTCDSYKFTHNDTLETAWTLLPSVILVFIAIPSLLVLFALDEIGKPILTVKAIGHQWYWSYELTSSVESSSTKTWSFDSYMIASDDLKIGEHRNLEVDNALHLPVNAHIRLLVTSVDVIHSWAVPALGVKIDAVPGRLNQVGLFIDRHGVFYGQCSEICGTNHGFMPIRIHSYPGYSDWYGLFTRNAV